MSDPTSVGDFADVHLRGFVAARNADDAVAMRRHWEELVIHFRLRMDGLVRLEHRGRLDPDEHEDAVQLALVRFSTKLAGSFKGTTMGELVNATKRAVQWACIDVQRQNQRHDTVPLDGDWGDPDRETRSHEIDLAERLFDDAEHSIELREFFASAFDGLDDRKREVLQLSLFSTLSDAEIAEQLGTTTNNVQQLRSRALRELRRLYREHFDA